jgi:hypothetical protein
VQGSYDGAVGSRAGEYQQHGGNDDQEIIGGSDPERRVDAEGNAGDNGNARSKDACGSVDPSPRKPLLTDPAMEAWYNPSIA